MMPICTKDELVVAIRKASRIVDGALQLEDMEFYADLPVLELSIVGRIVGERAHEMDIASVKAVMDAVECAMQSKDARFLDQVATGFLEGLLSSWDENEGATPAVARLGPESRAYCIAFNTFHGDTRCLPTPEDSSASR